MKRATPTPETIQAMAAGSEKAFTVIYYHYERRVFSMCLKVFKDRDDARDALQMVFAKIWDKREKFREAESFEAYFHNLVRNSILHLLDQQKKYNKVVAEYLTLNPDTSYVPDDFDADMPKKKIGEIIDKAVENMPPQQRLIHILNKVGGLKHTQIAEKLGLSFDTVQHHSKRAMKTIRDQFGGVNYNPEAI